MNKKLSFCAGLIALATGLQAGQPIETGAPEIISHRTNPHGGTVAPTVGSTGKITPAITYHGGALMAAPNVYVIWYGNWNQGNGTDTPAGQAIINDFLTSIGGSPYYGINKTYSATGKTISGNATYAGSATDNYSQGSRLKDNDIESIVKSAISANKLPKDANGVYFVLTSSDVAENSGFCNRYCGWHTHGNVLGGDIKFAFVGNSARCLSGCAAQTISPNGNPGVDGMVSVVAHELSEATTDPDLNAWYDSQGAENADKCAWTFGTSQQTATGAWYNVTLGTRNYLIQRNLAHGILGVSGTGDYCVLQ